MSVYSESYWKRREEADEEREQPPEVATSSRTAAPETVASELWDAEIGEPVQSPGKPYGPVEPPPATPEPEADWAGFSPSSPAAPAAPAAPPTDDTKAQRLKAIERMRSLADAPMDAPMGLRDADLAAAAKRDRQAVQRSNLSEAIAAAFARRPARLQSEPSESASLMQRRAMSEKSAGDALGRKLSAEARIAAALKGEKVGSPDGLTPYQRENLSRRDADDKYRADKDSRKAEADAAALEGSRKAYASVLREMGVDPATASQKDIDRAISIRNAMMIHEGMSRGDALKEEQFYYRKERDVEQDTKDLAKSVGDEPQILSDLMGRLDAATKQSDIPGIGPIDRLEPDMTASPAALQTRNDMLESVRIMLSMRSGKTVTPQEATEYAKIYGLNGSEEAFRQGVQRLKADVAATIKAKKAGFSPKARERFEGAGGTPTPEQPGPPASEKPPPGVIPPNARNVKRLGKGWAYTLPDGTQEIWEP